MRHVWVLRHAKAVAHSEGDDDRSRPITARGRRQGAALEHHLAEVLASGAPTPGAVLCSSAVRARQTAEAVLPALAGDVELSFEGELYGADPDDIVTRLRMVPHSMHCVMVVGHNPTLHELVMALLDPDDHDGCARVEDGFPTAALALVALPADRWTDVTPGSGRLLELFVPPR
jgi:phosphohistidine phosphatase